MSTICVLGATGTQGGSVCEVLLKNKKWKVRGVTRNVNSESAKKLAAKVCNAYFPCDVIRSAYGC